MADTKITALTALTAADPSTDVLPIVDTSDTTMAASGTTKKISINNILGASGTATLASATITGDLTVDTSTLKVDSTNNRVGIGTASPAATLDVRGGNDTTQAILTGTANRGLVIATRSDSLANDRTVIFNAAYATGSLGQFAFQIGGSDKMLLDSSGNLGLGVTPSAWGGYKSIDISGGGGITALSNGLYLTSNAYDNSGWKYKANGYATLDLSVNGERRFYTAASGTAGNAITFTQAMTLDASGNLLLATTSNSPSARQYINQASGSNPALYIAGGASTTPLINFNGAGRFRSDGSYLVMETTNASGVIYVTANTNGVYLAAGGTSWTANSDERLKDIIEPIGNAVEKVASLRSVIGKFKNDQTNTRRSFLIAQDVQAVLPEAVDASNPDKLGVAYSEVIPLLVAAIKELTARVQTLETR